MPSTLSASLAVLVLTGTTFADVEIEGNRRTKRATIIAAAEVPDGPLDEGDLAEVRQRLMNTKLFQDVDITGEGGNVRIRVRERWTLFPVPYVSSSSRGTQGGIFLLESNLLGRGKTLVVGGAYATWGLSGLGLYIDPSVGGTRATLRATANYVDSQRERRVDDRVVFEYEDKRVEGSVLGGYRITERFALSVGGFAQRVRADDMSLPTGINYGPAAALEYRGANLRDYYEEGLTVTGMVKRAFTALGATRDVTDVTARAQYTRAFLWNQATTIAVQLDAVDGHPILDTRLFGGRIGTRGFETQSLWVDRSVTLVLDHQIPLLQRGWGTTTLTGFVDLGHTEGDLGTERFVTPGVGMRLYLARMNFPAVGFDVAFAERVFVTLAIGMSL
jgi:outer membrane protein assembly factor BamA